MTPLLAAVILAAGDSTRMGTPKALLADPDGRPFVARIVRAFHAAGIGDVTIVTGSQDTAIRDAVTADQPPVAPRLVRNPDPARGPLSSLWVGLEAVMRPDLEAILMTLADVPMVQPATIRAVVETWRATGAPIVRPAIGDRHGHPVLFDRAVFDELRAAPLEAGAKAVVHAHAARVVNVTVDDEGCLTDIDTPVDYEAMLRKTTARG
jgi:CTP:molybdopterin cytidylyltransferase MocA